MVKAAILLDQLHMEWENLNCFWKQSGKPYQFPELVNLHDQAECYLVIAAADMKTLAGLTLARKNPGFDPNKPVIWVDLSNKVANIFGSTTQLVKEIKAEEYETARNIRRLIARLLVS